MNPRKIIARARRPRRLLAVGALAALGLFAPMFHSCDPGPPPENCQNHLTRYAVNDTWFHVTVANIDWGVDPACWVDLAGDRGDWGDVWSYQAAGPFQDVTCYGNHTPSYADPQHKAVNWSLGPGAHTFLGTVCFPGATQGGCISYISTPPYDTYGPSYDRVGCSILNDEGDFYLSYQGNTPVVAGSQGPNAYKATGPKPPTGPAHSTTLAPWMKAAIAKFPASQRKAETAKLFAYVHQQQKAHHIVTVP